MIIQYLAQKPCLDSTDKCLLDGRRRSQPAHVKEGKGRKRSRARLGTFAPAIVVAVFSVAMFPSILAFSVISPSHRTPLALDATKLETRPITSTATPTAPKEKRKRATIKQTDYPYDKLSAATRVRPRKAISNEMRQRALKAMNAETARQNADTALKGVDAQVLELLSDHFLYPDQIRTSLAATISRPKGRPEFVPGAMNYDTLLKYRERQEFVDNILNQADSARPSILPYSAPPVELGSQEAPSSPSKASAAPTKTMGVKGSPKRGASSSSSNTEITEAPARKRRKRVVKSLPEPRSNTEKNGRRGKPVARKRTKGGNLELHKYYRTELLSSDEEYALGMKTQFMVKCENVHEGLSMNLMRLPTIQEWAEACG